jgi:hypothetical protein
VGIGWEKAGAASPAPGTVVPMTDPAELADRLEELESRPLEERAPGYADLLEQLRTRLEDSGTRSAGEPD